MRHITSLTSAAAIALLGLSLAAPPATAGRAPAPPPAIKCGDTITTSVVLTRNLTCAGDGLTVQGAGITVNLNGRRITGSGTGAGIIVSGFGPSGVSVVGGRISGFEAGVSSWVSGTRLSDVVLSGNGRGVQSEAPGLVVERSTFASNRTGIAHRAFTQVSASTFRGNDTAISCGDAELRVATSRFTANRRGISADVCGVGISSSDFSGGEVGAYLGRPAGYTVDVRDSTFRGALVGLEVRESLGGIRVISGNQFRNNGASGLVIDNETVTGGTFEVSGNTFQGNGFAPGTFGDGSPQPTSGVWANVGTFSNNQARGNAGNGIEAYGVIDGGSNTARGNRTEPQCLGVVCTR